MKLRFSVFVSVCFISLSVLGQSSLEKGMVHDSILVSGASDETFAIYLPESFEAETLSSIVFIFEPAARGARGITPFIPASENYGHMLVCSNNSRNGPYDRNFGIANRLFEHIFNNFLIQQDEMYLSGFSGGSRLASAIATLTNRFAGVVGCGAGFSEVRDHKPSVQTYAYAGLCGTKDMNYREMLRDTEFLGLLKFNSTLITYDGEHRWPPSEQILRAFDWLHLQKVKRTGVKDSTEILDLYTSDYAQIQGFKTMEELLFASEQYKRMLKSYDGLIQADSLSKQHKELIRSKPYKKRVAAHTNALKIEQKQWAKLTTQILHDFLNPNKTNFAWWEKEMNKLDGLAENGDAEIANMVHRLKFDLFARAYSRKNNLMYKSNQEQIALTNRFLDLLSRKNK